MAKYAYKAQDAQEKLMTGTLDAGSVDEALDRLAEKKLTPLSVTELNFDGTKKGETFLEKLNATLQKRQARVPMKSVVFFTRQLATMLEAGVPLSQSLIDLASGEQPVFKKIILQVENDISMGNTFSDSIGKHPGAFNNMYVAVVRSGEVAGALEGVLEQLATYMESAEAMRQKVKGAMRYPTFISGFVFLMVLAILLKLVPVFESMYAGFNVSLPALTNILIMLSRLIRNHFPVLLLGLVGAGAGLYAAFHHPGFRAMAEKYMLSLPIYGLIIKKNIWASFSRTMALLLEAGTPILQAVEITSAVVGNAVYTAKLKVVHDKLRTGESFSETLKNSGVFPPLVIQLASTGEKSGRIDSLLRKSADFYEREIKVTVESISSIIEPVLIIFIGSLVGGIVIALYLPIFSLGKLVH